MQYTVAYFTVAYGTIDIYDEGVFNLYSYDIVFLISKIGIMIEYNEMVVADVNVTSCLIWNMEYSIYYTDTVAWWVGLGMEDFHRTKMEKWEKKKATQRICI